MEGNLKDENDSEDESILNKKFFNKYKCVKKLGEGSFGKIYKAECNGKYFALKFESTYKGQGLLEGEANIMNYLKGPNIPYVKSFGFTNGYNILVMQLLGKSLEDIFEARKRISIKSVCMCGVQIISVLEYVHNKHIVHRDIKPDNFVMGLEDLSKFVYLLDFGLAKKYRSSTTLVQYPMTNKKKLTGTARYASIHALGGYEQSRRDDLEAVGYVLIYFLRGSLPWQGLQARNKEERYKKILQKKIDTSPYDLCYGFPKELEKYVEYTRNLEYEEEPNYEMLRGLFMKILRDEELKYDYIFDWTTEEEKKMRKAGSVKTEDYNKEKRGLKSKDSHKRVKTEISQDNEEQEQDKENDINAIKQYKRNPTNIINNESKMSLKAILNRDGDNNIRKDNDNSGISCQNIVKTNNKNDGDKNETVCCSSACKIF